MCCGASRLGLLQEAPGQEVEKCRRKNENISHGNPPLNIMAPVGGWPLHCMCGFFISPSSFIVHCPLLSSF